MRSIPEIAAVALLIVLPVAALPMPTAIDTVVSPAAHTPSSGLGPVEDHNQVHAAQSANGAQAAEEAINQILQNRLKEHLPWLLAIGHNDRSSVL